MPADYEVRIARQCDASHVVELIERCYQGTYTLEAALDPARVAADIAAGSVVVGLAWSPAGEPVGTAALEVLTPVAGVYGRAVVDRAHRGQGLFGKLSQRLVVEAARERGLAYVHSCVVTNHDYAQRQLAGLGLEVSGLLLGLYPDDMRMRGIGGVDQPVSSVQLVLVHEDEPFTRRLGLHGADLPRARAVLDAFGIASSRRRTTRGARQVRWSLECVEPLGLSHLRPSTAGETLEPLLADCSTQRLVWVDVPVTDPGAQHTLDALRTRGFCYGAYLLGLGHAGSDVIRMQRYQGAELLSREPVVLAPPYAGVRDDVFAEYEASLEVVA